MLTIGNLPHAFEYVVVAALVCVLSNWAAFQLIAKNKPERPLPFIEGAIIAISIGLGIWSTHFIAVLGLRPDFLISYSAIETAVSILIAVLLTGGAMAWASRRERRYQRCSVAAASGFGVSAMHHVGMIGLSGCIVTLDPMSVLLASLIVATLFTLALEIAKNGSRFASIKAAAVSSSGVVMLHFGSLAGTMIEVGPTSHIVISGQMLSFLQLISILVLLIPLYQLASVSVEKHRENRLAGYVAMVTGEGVLSLAPDGRVVWANSAFKKLTGLTTKQLIHQASDVIVAAMTSKRDAQAYEFALRNRETVSLTLECQRSGGETYWQHLRLYPRLAQNGRLLGFVSAHKDVTAEVHSQQKLAESESEARQLALVAKHTTDAIVITDDRGHIIWVNDSFTRLTGYGFDEVKGRKPGSFLQGPKTSESAVSEISRALILNQPIKTDLLNYTKSGSPYWIQLSISPINNSVKNSRFIAVSHDITPHVRRESNLVEALDKAKSADKIKSEFLAKINHEIRTPINGVVGMSELLSTTNLDDKQEMFLSHIKLSSDRLLKLVSDILDFESIEKGGVELEYDRFSLNDLLEELRLKHQGSAAAKGLQLSAACDPQVPLQLVGDRRLLQKILTNLLHNAIMFTHDGSVCLKASIREAQTNVHTKKVGLRLEVVDTGVGIPLAAQATIFDRFTQVDDSEIRETEGMGLGLAIAAGLVQEMGGELKLDSSQGLGSTFMFDLVFDIEDDQPGTGQVIKKQKSSSVSPSIGSLEGNGDLRI